MEFIVTATFDVSAMDIYDAWLSSEGHTAMTGGEAKCSSLVGATFSAWDGYITGQNLELVPGKLIRQSWRSDQFDPGQPDSIVEIAFSKTETGKTLVSIKHSHLQDADLHYKQGWLDYYFTPMKAYFG